MMRHWSFSFIRNRLRSRKAVLFAAALTIALAVLPSISQAQYSAEKPLGAAAQSKASFLKDAGISQNLDHQLPLNDHFRDSSGADVLLGSYFHKRPVVLALVYFKCRLLCPQVMNGMATALRQVGFTAGKQYDVIIASFDPSDTSANAAEAKQRFISWLGNPDAASSVHFLTGPEASITDLAQATGFHYVQVPGPDGKMDQYAHSSVIMIATPEGRMSKYLSGIQYPPRDLRMALIEASDHRIGSVTDLILLYCCSYSPSIGRYTVSILRVLGLAAMASLFALSLLIFLLTRKRKMAVPRSS